MRLTWKGKSEREAARVGEEARESKAERKQEKQVREEGPGELFAGQFYIVPTAY